MPKPFSAIPGPKGWPLIGSLLDYSRFGRFSYERMHLAKRENFAVYGKIYKERLGQQIVNIYDPADIETVCRALGKYPVNPVVGLTEAALKRDKIPLGLGSLNGEPWWRIRSAVQQKMMSPSAVHLYLPIQNEVADDFVKLLSRKLDIGSGKFDEDITELLSRYTMEAFGAVCFNVRIGCLEPSISPDSDAFKVIGSVNSLFEAMQKTLFAFPWYAVYRTKLYQQFVDALRTCQGIAQTYVDKALMADDLKDNGDKVKDNGEKVRGKNFLQTLIDSNSERLTNEEMVHVAIDLFAAGIDSTAFALSFCLYNLAKNVDKQDRLHLEIDSVLGRTSGSLVTSEVLNRMPYMKACVKESFRLNFPVISGPLKFLATDLVLSDYLVPKGTLVWMNNQAMCLQEEHFKDADRYLPERWMKGEGNCLRPASSFVMLPFGHGSRMCIGRRFAEQEIYLALVKLLHRFRLQLDVDASENQPIGMINRIFTMPDARIPLKFIPR